MTKVHRPVSSSPSLYLLSQQYTFCLDLQVPVERTPVSRVFLIPDEYHLLQHRATITAVRRRITAKRLPIRDAFIAFNSSRTGALSCSEMYGALEWLGIRVTPSQVQEHFVAAKISAVNARLLAGYDRRIAFDVFPIVLIPI